jgi:hypothetical protein
MSRIGWVVYIALCGCLSGFVRVPKETPADGKIECTDSMERPIALVIGAVVAAGLTAYAAMDFERTFDHGGIIWFPLLPVASLNMLITADFAHSYVVECRDAKRRGTVPDVRLPPTPAW